jgi:hypothetical protein
MEASTATKTKRAPRTKKAAAAPEIAEVPAPSLFVEEVTTPVPVIPAPRKKKPTGAAATRKPPVVATVSPDGIIGSLSSSDPRPLIAYMPIRMADIQGDLFAATPSAGETTGDSTTVIPFDATDNFVAFDEATAAADSAIELVEDGVTVPEVVVPAASRPTLPMYYSEKLMIRYLDANREQRLPETTEVACFWDCSPFKGMPCVIPVKIEEDIWRVYGNFCCPECAAAFLFNERLDTHVQWERYALLNRLYAGGGAETVRLAAPRAVLRLFGGNMDVSEYRALVSDKRMRVDVVLPPMISITQVMDTKPIDFYDATVKNNFIPWEMDRMNRPGAQGLRLRRTKPVAEKEATLEWCMGISRGAAAVHA